MRNGEKSLYLQYRGRIFGPFSWPELQEMSRSGRIDASAQISRDKVVWSAWTGEELALPQTAVPQEPRPMRAILCSPSVLLPKRPCRRRIFGTVLQALWNAPAAAAKLARFSGPEFWKWGFGGAFVLLLFLLEAAGASTAFFSDGMGRKMLTILSGTLIWSAIVMGELRLLRKATDGGPARAHADGVFFILCSAGAAAVSTEILLGESLLRMLGWRHPGACVFGICMAAAAVFGVVNWVCGMHRTLIRDLGFRPAAALYGSTFFLLQGALLLLCCRI